MTPTTQMFLLTQIILRQTLPVDTKAPLPTIPEIPRTKKKNLNLKQFLPRNTRHRG